MVNMVIFAVFSLGCCKFIYFIQTGRVR
uniref:Uncharacterized protein n=1 Tax=Arundo donax TaxID=35708 RepID=A0A0A9SWG7_ARUDO